MKGLTSRSKQQHHASPLKATALSLSVSLSVCLSVCRGADERETKIKIINSNTTSPISLNFLTEPIKCCSAMHFNYSHKDLFLFKVQMRHTFMFATEIRSIKVIPTAERLILWNMKNQCEQLHAACSPSLTANPRRPLWPAPQRGRQHWFHVFGNTHRPLLWCFGARVCEIIPQREIGFAEQSVNRSEGCRTDFGGLNWTRHDLQLTLLKCKITDTIKSRWLCSSTSDWCVISTTPSWSWRKHV